jgi:hypothetical protein
VLGDIESGTKIKGLSLFDGRFRPLNLSGNAAFALDFNIISVKRLNDGDLIAN